MNRIDFKSTMLPSAVQTGLVGQTGMEVKEEANIKEDDAQPPQRRRWYANLRELLDWIFGPHGVQSVQVVACGDYTCRGRFAQAAFVVKRVGLSWEIYEPREKRDRAVDRLLDDHKEFLESAPTAQLLSIDSLIYNTA
jgi:hypothetical protein